jgi:excisionase family DNA binding protein
MSSPQTPQTTTETLITKREAAGRLGVSTRTLEGLMRDRAIRFVRIAKRRIGFRPSDVERFIESRTVNARY